MIDRVTSIEYYLFLRGQLLIGMFCIFEEDPALSGAGLVLRVYIYIFAEGISEWPYETTSTLSCRMCGCSTARRSPDGRVCRHLY